MVADVTSEAEKASRRRVSRPEVMHGVFVGPDFVASALSFIRNSCEAYG